MIIAAKDLKRARNGNKYVISQPLFRIYADACASALKMFLGVDAIVLFSHKTNSVYVHPPCSKTSVRISDHNKRGESHTVLIRKRHPKDDDLAQELDEALRNCYRDHHGEIPSWDQIAIKVKGACKCST